MPIIFREVYNHDLDAPVVSFYSSTDESCEEDWDLDTFYIFTGLDSLDVGNFILGGALVLPFDDGIWFHVFDAVTASEPLSVWVVLDWANGMSRISNVWYFSVGVRKDVLLMTEEGMMFWEVLEKYTQVHVSYPKEE